MNHYELLYLFDIPASEEALQTLTNRVSELITQEKGAIVHQESLGRRRLAFPIKKTTQGIYQSVEFDLSPSQLIKLKRALTLDQAILRFQIISIKPRTEADRRPTLPESLAPRAERRHEEKREAKIETKPPLTTEELDKKLDEILEQDIVK